MTVALDPAEQFAQFAHPERPASGDWLEANLGTPGLVDRGTGKDPLGREGSVVEIPVTEGGATTIRVVFDPDSSEVLSWSEHLRDGNGGVSIPGQDHMFLTAGHVASISARP